MFPPENDFCQELIPGGTHADCHYTIASPQVHGRAFDLLQGAPLRDHGRKCTAPVVFAVLFWAAARMTSLAAACAALRAAPCDQAVRNALLATLPDFARLQGALNRALRATSREVFAEPAA